MEEHETRESVSEINSEEGSAKLHNEGDNSLQSFSAFQPFQRHHEIQQVANSLSGGMSTKFSL